MCQLGGKDPAYVRSDADLDYTVAELVDGKYWIAMAYLYQPCDALLQVHTSTLVKVAARLR